MDTGLDIEFNHVKAWALRNRLLLNISKTKEKNLYSDNPKLGIFICHLLLTALNS